MSGGGNVKMRMDWNPLGARAGYCRCGCGRRTPIATRNRRERGVHKGQHMPFIRYHQGRLRFEIDDRSGCWLWQGAKDKDGYALTRWDYRSTRVHRALYEHVHGLIPDGLVLDHVVCNNPSCVNPAHLEPVTSAENTRRGRNTRLTATQVQEIRSSDESGAVLAGRFGVRRGHIYRIRARGAWATVGKPAR